MNAIRDEAGRQFVACEEALHHVVMSRKQLRDGVSKMRGQRRAGANGRIDFGLGSVRMPERNDDTALRDLVNERGAVWPFGSEREEPDVSARRILQSLKCCDVGCALH